MSGHEHQAQDGPIDWDAMYAGSDRVWSGRPNGALVAEVEGLRPGTVLDVGCGEGADAIWLAGQGWRVTGLDVAPTALRRAAAHAAQAGVELELLHTGLTDAKLDGRRFDLVSAQYPALAKAEGPVLDAVLSLVAPGGTLLFVHHADAETEGGMAAGFDREDYLLPRDVRAALGPETGWEVLVDELRPRHVEQGAGAGHTVDRVLRARRLPGPGAPAA